MFTRRSVLSTGAAALAAACADAPGAQSPTGLVTVNGTSFLKDGAPYRYCGANIWYGAYLGAAAEFGSRDRLRRELDRLRALGVDNLRVLGSSELSPLNNSITPAFRTNDANYNEELLVGLDFLLAEMGQRDMRAVLYLTNFWEWSGGMMTYLSWVNGGDYINMNDPAHPWPEFPDFNAQFYSNAEAIALYHDYVRAVVSRTNSVTGRPYSEDATIMAWQLANEPRPGGSDAIGRATLPAFYSWIRGTARLIKSLDANHLVSTGSEGLKGCIELPECVSAAHEAPEIDYVTAHIWPQNWSWADPRNLERTYPVAEANTREYIQQHIGYATQLNRPLVIEEFGFPRDNGSFEPGSPTTFKDHFYGVIYGAVAESAAAGGPLAGSNFWAWGGEGRSQHEDKRFHPGDTAYVGDPPHEPQGWYSVFDGDESTVALIRDHAAALQAAAPAQRAA